MHLYRLPNGKIIDIHQHPTMAITKWCNRCNRPVTKWHEHLTDPTGKDKSKPIKLVATSLWIKRKEAAQ